VKTLILLVEGLVEKIVYSSTLERLYGGKHIECKNVLESLELKSLEELIGSIERRIECYTLERGDLVIIVDCGGYENLKEMTRLLLSKRKELLIKVLKQLDLRMVIAADRDKKPVESIRGLLSSLRSSMGFQVTEDDAIAIEFGNGTKLVIHIVEQGGEADTATGGVEDELRKLVETLEPKLQHITKKIEETYEPLTDKQKLLIYLALLERKPKIREFYEILRKIMATISRDTIERSLENLVKSLEKALK